VTSNIGAAGMRSWAVHPGNITGVEPPATLPVLSPASVLALAFAMSSAGLVAIWAIRAGRGTFRSVDSFSD
jgi:hypothetical protein